MLDDSLESLDKFIYQLNPVVLALNGSLIKYGGNGYSELEFWDFDTGLDKKRGILVLFRAICNCSVPPAVLAGKKQPPTAAGTAGWAFETTCGAIKESNVRVSPARVSHLARPNVRCV